MEKLIEIICTLFIGIASLLVLYRALFGGKARTRNKQLKTRRGSRPGYGSSSFESNLQSNGKDNKALHEMEGYLTKRGSKIRHWRKRYFLTKGDGRLRFAASKEDIYRNLKGIIHVQKVSVMVIEGRLHTFQVTGTSGVSYLLSASSDEEAQKWIICLSRQLVQNKQHSVEMDDAADFHSALSDPNSSAPVKHVLDVQLHGFKASDDVPPSSGRRERHYCVVFKVKSDTHNLSTMPVGQSHTIKGSVGIGTEMVWEEEKHNRFSWQFQDHVAKECMECLSTAASTKMVNYIQSNADVRYRGLPTTLTCQLWETTMLRNRKIGSGTIGLVDLFGFRKMESAANKCSWPLFNNEIRIGEVKISLKYESKQASGKVPFLTCSKREMTHIGTENRKLERIATAQRFYDKFLKDGNRAWDAFYEERGDTEVETGNWEHSAQYGGQIRKVTFRSLTHSPIGPPSTMSTSHQHVEFTEDQKSLTFRRKVVLHDIPYGDCFTVQQVTIVGFDDAGSLCINDYLAVPFSKGCMFKSKILTNSFSGVRESTEAMYRSFTNAMMSRKSLSVGSVDELSIRPHSLFDDTVALEEIFENQRISLVLGWGAGHLLPTDRCRFSNRSGDTELHFTTINAPENWEWTSSWKIDYAYTDCDDEGWSYATDFPRFRSHLQKGKSNTRKLGFSVRRRRWIRTLCKVQP